MARATDLPAPGPARSQWIRHGGGLALLAGAGLGLAAIAQWRDHHVLMINVSQSLPNWAFLVREGTFPRRGDYVVFAPGHALLVRRHFGERPQPFVKIAYGVPGDRVTREGATVARTVVAFPSTPALIRKVTAPKLVGATSAPNPHAAA